jgi:hypothetical protein
MSKPKSDLEARCARNWDMIPAEEVEDLIIDAAALAGQPFAVAHLVFCKHQASAQRLKDSGRVEVSRGRLAILCGVDVAAIDSILSAFATVGLVVDGRLATYIKRKPRKNGHDYKNGARAAGARAADAGAADAKIPETNARAYAGRTPDTEKPAPDVRPASQIRAESSESSPNGDGEGRDIPSSSVILSPARDGVTMMTDEELVNLVSSVNPARLTRRVASKGLPVVRKWLADGFELTLDVLPEIGRIVADLKGPLGSLSADFVTEAIRARHETRLSGAIGPPPGRADQPSKPLTAAQVRARIVYGKSGSNGRQTVNGVSPFALPFGRPS